MIIVGFLLPSLSPSPTPCLFFFPSFLANTFEYGIREKTRCSRTQTMKGQPPPGDSGMDKVFSNQLQGSDSSALPRIPGLCPAV